MLEIYTNFSMFAHIKSISSTYIFEVCSNNCTIYDIREIALCCVTAILFAKNDYKVRLSVNEYEDSCYRL